MPTTSPKRDPSRAVRCLETVEEIGAHETRQNATRIADFERIQFLRARATANSHHVHIRPTHLLTSAIGRSVHVGKVLGGPRPGHTRPARRTRDARLRRPARRVKSGTMQRCQTAHSGQPIHITMSSVKTVNTQPFEGQKPGTSGLRKRYAAQDAQGARPATPCSR